MQTAIESPYLVPFDGRFSIRDVSTAPPASAPGKRELRARRAARTDDLRDLQRKLFAEGRQSLLVVFQALDAAGKDGTIRSVFSGVNPAGCRVTSFGPPSKEEAAHDFLWRTAVRLPQRGFIGVFNRSYYEEVLVVRVRPELLRAQGVVLPADPAPFWQGRLDAIVDHERHLARQGTAIVKFFLHVGADAQRERLLRRIDDPDRNWKFDDSDVEERQHRAAYLDAYEHALQATNRPWAPWYAIPADSKPFMRAQVADIVARTLEGMNPRYPSVSDARRQEIQAMRARLLGDGVVD